jgi:hypothetical protein
MQLKRDLKKFEEIKVKRSEAGKKSAETKAQQNSTNSTLVESVQHPSTNSTDNDNDNDNVNVNVNDNVINGKIPAWEDFLAYALQNKPLVSKLDLKLKYDAWVVNGWKKQSKDGKLVKIANWKGTLLNTLPYIANTPAPQVRRVSL